MVAARGAAAMILRNSITFVVALAGVARAELVEDPCACSANKPGFFRRANLTGDWDDLRDKLKDAGVVPQFTYAGEVFASPKLDNDFVFAGLAVLSLDLDLTKLVDDNLGAVHVSALGIHGSGLSDELMDVYGVSGNVGPSDVRLFEAWIEQPISKATIRVGLLSADQEFILARHSTALLNATFGIISQASVDILGPVYPVARPGGSARLELSGFTARAAIYDGAQLEKHGIPTGIAGHPIIFGEVEFAEWVKLGLWHHLTLGSGYYAVVDHQLDRYFGVFVRGGDSPNNDETISRYVDAGVRIGPGPIRKGDFIGVGVAYAATRQPDGTSAGHQSLVEATYQAQFGWLTIQPDFQILALQTKTAAIAATRVTIVF